MIIYASGQETGFFEPEIWPENTEKIRRMIDIYKAKNKDSIKSFGLSDFLHDRAKKIEDELSKLRKKNMEARYPTWMDFLNGFTEVQLREFAANLRVKLEDVRSRANNLKKSQEVLDVNLTDFGRINPFQNQSFFNPGMIQRGNIEFEVINQQAMSSIMHFPSLDHNQELHSVNQNSIVYHNSMMMPMWNDDDHCMQFGGASTSGNISCQNQGFYESTSLDPTLYYSPRSLARFYTPPEAPTQYMMSMMLPEQIPMAMPPLPPLPGFSKQN
ncbi:uncharacterized protein LOC142532509 [Primulina tabacum]|uniref:uncharacterized protein LOC142532509 n=1 Tax=Primulina tabacum TaxID=48773 RepID=UPI003F5A0BC1